MIVYLCDWMAHSRVHRRKRSFIERVKQGFFRHYQIEIVVEPIKDAYAVGDSVFMHPSQHDEWIKNKNDEHVQIYRESGRASGTTTAMVHRAVEELMVDNLVEMAVIEAKTASYGCEILKQMADYAKSRGYPVGRLYQQSIEMCGKAAAVGHGRHGQARNSTKYYTDHYKERVI